MINMDDLDHPWNDQFKISKAEYKPMTAPRKRHRLSEDGTKFEIVNLQTEVEEEEIEEGNCPLSLQNDNRTNLYMVLYGYIQGLYPSEFYPATGCIRCQNTAQPFSQMIYALFNVLTLFVEFISSTEPQSGTEQLQFLYDSYLVFWDFGSNFDALLNDTSAIIQYN